MPTLDCSVPSAGSISLRVPLPEVRGFPPACESESTSLRSLVHHAGWIEHDLPLEQARRIFAELQVEFLALVRDGTVTGICSRLRLGNLLGARYGFALYSRSPAHLAQIERTLVFIDTTPIRAVLDAALARPGDDFHEDVALVDENQSLIGLIPIDALARLQSRLVSEQISVLQQQQRDLLAANNALRESRGRYTGLFDNHALGVALLDGSGAVQTHNARLAELLNISAADVGLGALVGWVAETDRASFRAVLESQASGQAAPVAREFAFAVPGRGSRVLRCSFGWIAETRQISACVDDVTEQRAMERQLARQEKQSLLDTLVGGIAHELNNKLTPVQGFSELVGQTADPQTRHYSELITKSVDEAARIIRQLLQLSKPSAAMQIVDLRAVAAEAISMLRFQIRDARGHVKVAARADAIWVRADPGELKQVIMNLVLNAIQAVADRTSPLLEVEVTEADGRAQIIVVDNGVGIPAENLERIFDPFFTTKGPERGTGLGLSVCYSIVRRHGGEIHVQSEVGSGARFTVALPIEHGIAPVCPAIPSDVPPPLVAEIGTNLARVLVVEDEPHIRRLIQTVLSTRFACEVDTVSHGVEAFERLAVQRYALVISDIRMPEMSGTELYFWLREAQPLTARRFIFVTGYPGENHFEEEIANLQIPVLTKPFTVAQLCAACGPFLDRAGAMIGELGAEIASA